MRLKAIASGVMACKITSPIIDCNKLLLVLYEKTNTISTIKLMNSAEYNQSCPLLCPVYL